MISKFDFEKTGGWVEAFAKESAEIGAAMAELNGDRGKSPRAALAWQDHELRVKNGMSPLCRLHSMIVAQAAAETWARAIQKSDFDEKSGSSARCALREGLIPNMRALTMSIKIDATIACFAHLSQELSMKFHGAPEQAMAKEAAWFAEEGVGFSDDITAAIRDALLGPKGNFSARKEKDNMYAKLRKRSADKMLPPSSNMIASFSAKAGSASVLFREALRRMWTEEGHTPEGRLFLLREAIAIDNPMMLKDFPFGVHDGVALFLPLRDIAALIGEDGATERATSVLRQAARGVLGLAGADDAGAGRPKEIPAGSMRDELLSRGLLAAASQLCRGPMETRLRESGEDVESLSAALRSACLGEMAPRSDALPTEAGSWSEINAELRSATWHSASGEVAKCLKAGADPRSASARGLTPLMLAAAARNKELAALLAPLSDLSAEDAGGMSALHHAAGAGSWECCALLGPLASGQAKNSAGQTAADMARSTGVEGLGDWLEKCGRAVDERKALQEDEAIAGGALGAGAVAKPRRL